MAKLVGWFCKILSFIISHLPLFCQRWIGDLIGLLWFDVFRIRRRVAIENVGIGYPELSFEEKTKLARSSLRHMGYMLVEFASFPFMTPAFVDKNFVFEGLEFLDAALQTGRGALLLTLHLGNGDYATAALSSRKYPMTLISKEFKVRWLNELWFGMRRKHGTKFISPEKSSFDILRALRKNELVIFVLDQFMGPPIGVRTNFFGKETGTAAGLALIAQRTGAPVIPCYTFRRGDGKTAICFEKPIETAVNLDDRPTPENIAVMTQVYTDKLESIIRRHPEQWMWIHRRWKEFRD
jgi:Kdo2-lipid IVA lauroyltransferase/acyltransferase